MHTVPPSLVEIYRKMTNLCYFNQGNPPFLSIPSIIFMGSLGISEKSQFVGDEMRMQTCRWTELLQMLRVTTTGIQSHVVSQALGEDRHRLVDVFSWHLFPNGLQSDFQLISCLMLRLEFMILFRHGAPDVTVQWVQIWRAWGPLSLLSEPVSHSVNSAGRSYTEKGGLSWLKQHNFVIFRRISTKLGDKVYIWLIDSHVKFHAKICTHGWNINKRHRGATFLCSPGICVWGQIGAGMWCCEVMGSCEVRFPTSLQLGPCKWMLRRPMM